MTNVAYDHQIFCLQKFGGISRYFCELASRIQYRDNWQVRVIAPIYFNRNLVTTDVARSGIYIPNRYQRFSRLYRWVNTLVAPAIMDMSHPDLVHQTYYQGRTKGSKVPVVVTVYDMIHELYPQHFAAMIPLPAASA